MRARRKFLWRWLGTFALTAVAVVAVAVALAGPTARPSESTARPSESSGPSLAGPISYVVGTVTAGPVCPTLQPSPLPCAPRPVAGAVITVSTAEQGEWARASTAADGSYRILLHGYGTVTVTALQVQGLMVTPAPVTVTLDPMETRRVDFEYGTGIS